jgi:hypothetical protein
MDNNQVVHLSAAGEELWRGGGFSWPGSVSVNSTDGSCWVSDTWHSQVVHLSAQGAELWRGSGLPFPGPIAVNPTDGSCWVGVSTAEQPLVHLSATGEELWRGGRYASSLSVNPTDGSCWAAGWQVTHFSAAGRQLWLSSDIRDARCVSVNPTDGSCWVADHDNGQFVQLIPVPSPFSDVPQDFWALDEIRACVDAGIVTGYEDGTYQPKREVTRGQMAAFIARAMCGGDQLVPTGPATATFSDVPVDSAFFRHVECAYTKGVVKGYADGAYQPTWGVNRGQMAAFLARAQCGGDAHVPTGPATASFTDVPPDFGFYWYIEYIYAAGVTTGYGDGTYHPEYACNRDQMAVLVARAFDLLP